MTKEQLHAMSLAAKEITIKYLDQNNETPAQTPQDSLAVSFGLIVGTFATKLLEAAAKAAPTASSEPDAD